jgi:hypothetical protein
MKKTASREIAKKGAPSAAPANANASATAAAPGGAMPLGLPSARASASPSVPPASSPGTMIADSNGKADASTPTMEEGSGKHSATTDAADRIIAANDAALVATHAENLTSDKPTTATASARILDDLLLKKPDILVAAVDRFVSTIASPNKRAVQTSAAALPVIAKLAPARVARHLPQLTEAFAEASDVGKDGLVTTFAALCTASVAYQKRLEPVLEVALSTAEPKTLQRWTEIVLPSLKGEPHARARAVVEVRLPTLPRPLAQPIATFLGIKLRPLGR